MLDKKCSLNICVALNYVLVVFENIQEAIRNERNLSKRAFEVATKILEPFWDGISSIHLQEVKRSISIQGNEDDLQGYIRLCNL